MKWILPLLPAVLLASCAEDPGHFNGGESRRHTSGNAPLEGPNADDVINDVHHDRARQHYEDRARQHYEDRTGKRRYGNF